LRKEKARLPLGTSYVRFARSQGLSGSFDAGPRYLGGSESGKRAGKLESENIRQFVWAFYSCEGEKPIRKGQPDEVRNSAAQALASQRSAEKRRRL